MHKRDFIAGASALAAACTASLAKAADDGVAMPEHSGQGGQGNIRRLPALEDRQSRATWARYVGQPFAVAGVGVLQLRRVDELPCGNPQVEQFKLVFDAPAGAACGGGTRMLRHASGQALAVHLEPSRSGQLHAHFSLLA